MRPRIRSLWHILPKWHLRVDVLVRNITLSTKGPRPSWYCLAKRTMRDIFLARIMILFAQKAPLRVDLQAKNTIFVCPPKAVRASNKISIWYFWDPYRFRDMIFEAIWYRALESSKIHLAVFNVLNFKETVWKQSKVNFAVCYPHWPPHWCLKVLQHRESPAVLPNLPPPSLP